MATLLRTGKLDPFAETKPGPKGPRKATGDVRNKVLALRAEDRRSPRSPGRWPPRARRSRRRRCGRSSTTPDCPGWPAATKAPGSPARLAPVKPATLRGWPDATQIRCDHAGLLLLFPAMAQLGLSELVTQAGYPSTSAITAWQSIGTLLLAKCARRHRAHHIDALTDDAGLAFGLRLSALPKATHAGTYSYRVRRDSNTKLLTGIVKALRPLGMASGTRDSTSISTPSATTAPTPCWRNTTCRAARSAPAPC